MFIHTFDLKVFGENGFFLNKRNSNTSEQAAYSSQYQSGNLFSVVKSAILFNCKTIEPDLVKFYL